MISIIVSVVIINIMTSITVLLLLLLLNRPGGERFSVASASATADVYVGVVIRISATIGFRRDRPSNLERDRED